MKGRKRGQVTTLYSVWRNSDDELLILDGTAEECAAKLGINKNSFWRLAGSTDSNYGNAYTITKIKTRDILREVEDEGERFFSTGPAGRE